MTMRWAGAGGAGSRVSTWLAGGAFFFAVSLECGLNREAFGQFPKWPWAQQRTAGRGTPPPESGKSTPPSRPPSLPSPQPAVPAEPPRVIPQVPQEVVGEPVRGAGGAGVWWEPLVGQTARPNAAALPLTLEAALVRAVRHSSQIRVFSELPLIRRTAIIEADAAFDWSTFLDSRWDDLNDPVGSSLTVGTNSTRYLNEQFANSAGLRKRTRTGGKFEAAERIGWQDTNSIYFVPAPQGTSRLSLSFTQPLLRGRGRYYNESLVVLAQIDTEVAQDEFVRQLQAHLLEVTRAYWGLYLERANLLLKRRSVERAGETLRQLKSRAAIDAVAAQVVRAEAEFATRQAEVVRAELAVQNAEARLRTLVDDPEMGDGQEVELLPQDLPTLAETPVDIPTAFTVAMQMRPEIGQAMKQIKAAGVRLDMSKNELLPVLNLVTEAYVAGLRGEGNIGAAINDQFSTGRPGYSVGLQFETPWGNRAARARNERRQIELRQLQGQYQTTVKTLKLEVEVAVREVHVSRNESFVQARAMQAGQLQLDYIQERWTRLPGEDGTASLVLENVLQAQERLARTESSFLTALVTYNLALMNLKRATGELLRQEQVTWSESDSCGVPRIDVSKPGPASERVLPIEPHGQPFPAPTLPPPRDEPSASRYPNLRNTTPVSFGPPPGAATPPSIPRQVP